MGLGIRLCGRPGIVEILTCHDQKPVVLSFHGRPHKMKRFGGRWCLTKR